MIRGLDNPRVFTAMMGAPCGDIIGSVYEWHNIKYKPDKNALLAPEARFTDDTVMTCAVAAGLSKGLAAIEGRSVFEKDAERVLFASVRDSMLEFGRRFPYAGYGGNFYEWLKSPDPEPYGSFGNGAAMRASYAGWVAKSLEEAEKLGEISASVTHDHPEGLKAASVIAGCIYLLAHGEGKESVREYAGSYYDLGFTLDEIRADYRFDVTCMGSVPQAINAFLEGEDFADVIALAVSIGGDSDTIGAIAGSLAEALYPIPQKLRGMVIDKMDPYLLDAVSDAVDFMHRRFGQRE